MSEFMKQLGNEKSAAELVEDAHKEVSALCHGKKWSMSIPVRAEDSDIIISEALVAQTREIGRLRAEIEQLRAQLEKAKTGSSLRIFVRDIDRGWPEFEITDLFWFEENLVNSFDAVGYTFRFELSEGGQP